jgi:hypothetical protein
MLPLLFRGAKVQAKMNSTSVKSAARLRLLETHSSCPKGGEWHLSAGKMTRVSSSNRATSFMAGLFLPNGYPDSVREGYATYQTWSLVQGLANYLRGAIAMKELLRGMGVGDAEATATAGAVGWIVRDGTGMAGSLLFSWWAAPDFDRNIRQWKIFADLVNNIGLTLNMLAPLLGRDGFLLATIGGSLLTSMCGVAGGATRASISQWFTKNGNIADCVAKEGTQQTAVNILGLIGGLALCNAADNILAVWILFLILTVIHSVANTRATSTLRFDVINEHRLTVLFERFWHDRLDAMSVSAVADAEPWLPSLWASSVLIGHNVENATDISCEKLYSALLAAQCSGAMYAIVHPSSRLGATYILLRPQCSPLDVLKARFFAQAKKMSYSRDVDQGSWLAFLDALHSAGWDMDRSALPVGEWRYDWNAEIDKDK